MGTYMQERERRKAAIVAEIAELGPGHPWAGVYLASMPLMYEGMVMAAPRSGYVEQTHYDSGGPPIPTVGEVSEANGSVHFTPAYGKSWSAAPVHWGERHYLVPEDRFRSFCQEINAGIQKRSPQRFGGRFLLRKGDESKRATGLPTLPEEYLRYIFKRPILVTVTDVIEFPRSPGDGPIREFHATIDRGNADGIFTKATFYELKALNIKFGEVVEVHEQTAVMKVLTLDGEPMETGSVFITRPVPGSNGPWS